MLPPLLAADVFNVLSFIMLPFFLMLNNLFTLYDLGLQSISFLLFDDFFEQVLKELRFFRTSSQGTPIYLLFNYLAIFSPLSPLPLEGSGEASIYSSALYSPSTWRGWGEASFSNSSLAKIQPFSCISIFCQSYF